MKSEKRILVVEDDSSTRQAWCELIASWGFHVDAAEDGERALELVDGCEPQILLLDLRLPRKDGLTVLKELHDRGLQVATIVISGQGDIPDAVRTIKLGAYDYLRKPVDPAHLKTMLQHLSTHLSVSEENQRLRWRLIRAGALGPLVGQSREMRRVMSLIEQVAPSSASVVIRGESGTGKEIAARTIHQLSPRHNGPYVAINCAALPENLMESELFGHERGAFTGADRRREGCFELADGGTLLLDEITEMRIELQAKLLRILEEHKLRRVGGTSEVPFDVRVLAASNRSLDRALAEGELREDLYYRLNVFTIEMPPLRERPEDIPLLADHFLRELSEANNRPVTGIDNDCMEILKSHAWPGNVRQLRNVLERALIVSRGPLLSAAELPAEIKRNRDPGSSFELRLGSSLDEVEREVICRTMESLEGNKVRAAEVLGISLKTLYNRLERYQARDR
jgi:DNA-binding NtrC family response regulator